MSHLGLGRHKQAEKSPQPQPSPACVLQYPCRERGGCLSSPFNLLENEKQTKILKGGSRGEQKEKPAIAHWYERFPYEPVICRQARGAGSRPRYLPTHGCSGDVGRWDHWGVAGEKLPIRGWSPGRVRSGGAADERAAETLSCLYACHVLKPLNSLS